MYRKQSFEKKIFRDLLGSELSDPFLTRGVDHGISSRGRGDIVGSRDNDRTPSDGAVSRPGRSTGDTTHSDVILDNGGNIDAASSITDYLRDHFKSAHEDGSFKTFLSALSTKLFGKAPTGAELFNYQWQEMMSNSSYQRQVADMQKAGLNPAIMYGGAGASGASTPSTTVSPSANPLDIFRILLERSELRFQKEVADKQNDLNSFDAQTRRIEALTNRDKALADIANKNADTAQKEVNTRWIDRLNQAALDSQNISGELTKEQIENTRIQREVLAHQADVLAEEVKNKSVQREVYRAQARLENASAAQIAALLPIQKAFTEAQTDTQKAQAAAMAVETAMKQGIYTEEYVKSVLSKAKSEAESAEAKAYIDKFEYAIVSGDYNAINHNLWQWINYQAGGTGYVLKSLFPIKLK